jgi:hypothetical protein
MGFCVDIVLLLGLFLRTHLCADIALEDERPVNALA